VIYIYIYISSLESYLDTNLATRNVQKRFESRSKYSMRVKGSKYAGRSIDKQRKSIYLRVVCPVYLDVGVIEKTRILIFCLSNSLAARINES